MAAKWQREEKNGVEESKWGLKKKKRKRKKRKRKRKEVRRLYV